jgi:hypothetical protein
MTYAIEMDTLTMEQLDEVNGGTFTPNKYDERIYNQAGLTTKYQFWCKDLFWIKDANGKEVSITYKQANWAVEYWKKHDRQAIYEIVAKNIKE